MTSSENNPSKPEQSQHDQDDESNDAFIERVKELYAFESTSLDDLLELSRDPQATGKFEDLLDDLTYKALSENEEFSRNIVEIKSGHHSEEEKLGLRDRQRMLFSQYKEAVLSEAGISTERSKNEMEISKQKIKELIQAELSKNPESGPQDILMSLGMLEIAEDGQEVFAYPEGLFPKSTDAKWATYIETVRSWVRIKGAVDAGMKDISELGEIDKIRRVAHNATARDVDEVLGLGKIPDSRWDFEKTRNLLAKMRDTRFPTKETGEKSVTERAVVEGVIGQHAIKALRTRTSDLHKPE